MTHLLAIFLFVHFGTPLFYVFFLISSFWLEIKVYIVAPYDNSGIFIVIPKNCTKTSSDVTETLAKIQHNFVITQDSANLFESNPIFPIESKCSEII